MTKPPTLTHTPGVHPGTLLLREACEILYFLCSILKDSNIVLVLHPTVAGQSHCSSKLEQHLEIRKTSETTQLYDTGQLSILNAYFIKCQKIARTTQKNL